jgi:hypothetical protein
MNLNKRINNFEKKLNKYRDDPQFILELLFIKTQLLEMEATNIKNGICILSEILTEKEASKR